MEETPTLQPTNGLGEEGPATTSISDDEVEFEFEFPSVSRDSPAAPADELFADGRIRCSSCRPVFFIGQEAAGRTAAAAAAQPAAAAAPAAPPRVVKRGQLGRLFLEESRARNSSPSSSSSVSFFSSDDDDDDDGGSIGGGGMDLLEGAPPDSYCLWTPAAGSSSSSSSSSPRPPRKSSSTGSVARWRRISDLVVGAGRSRSDGKDKFTFFFPAPPRTKEQEAVVRKHQVKPSAAATSGGVIRKAAPAPAPAPAEVDAAHRVAAYVAKGGGGGGGGTPRRTFLPYREELVGFFANVNGVRRPSHSHNHHSPFLTSS